MLINIILNGIVVGLLASVPLGPAGILCIQRTLSKGHKAGFISGLGAASSDTLFASIAFFSLSLVVGFIEAHLNVIKAAGGICISVIGIIIYTKNPVIQMRRNRTGQSNLWRDYLSAWLVAFANPAILLIFIALFAAVNLSAAAASPINALVMLAGVFAGGALWWFTLTFVVNLFRKNFRPKHLLWLNRIAGAVILTLGLLIILLLFFNIPVIEVIDEVIGI